LCDAGAAVSVPQVIAERQGESAEGLPLRERKTVLATAEAPLDKAREGCGAAVFIVGKARPGKRSVAEPVRRQADEPVESGGLLLERDSEISLIDALLTRVLRGEGRRMLIEGPAGIGKSTLLEHLGERARARGIELRACQCSKTDARVALSAARGLLGDGLEGVESAEGDRVASRLVQATLELAHSAPVLLTVDDAQWADQASLRFLAALARRIAGVPVAIALAVRESDLERGEALGELLDDRRALVLRPASLSVVAADALMATRLGERVGERLVMTAHRQTAGNPYLLTVVSDTLRHLGNAFASEPDALAGEIAAREATRLVAWHLDGLVGEERALLEAAAVLGELGPPEVLAVLVGADPAAWGDAARHLAGADLLVSARGTRLTHPLLAAALRATLGARRQIELVRAAATALVCAGRVEEAAARLAELPPTGHAHTAETLAQAAKIALARGAPELAARLLERALGEPPAPARRPELHACLGEALLALGRPDASEHLGRALEELEDPERRAAIARALALALTYTLQIEQAADVLARLANQLEVERPELAEELEAQTLLYESMVGSLRSRRLARLRKLGACRGHSELAYRMRLVELAAESHGACHPAEEITPWLERALAGGVLLTGAPEAHFKALVILTQLRRTTLARTQLRDAIADAQERGQTARVCIGLGLHAELALLEGNVLAAEADVRSALERVSYHELATPFSLKVLIEALIEQDRPDTALEELRRSGLTGQLPPIASQGAILYARGLAHHACGALQLALEEFELAGESLQHFGNDSPAALPWRSAAAIVLSELGDRVRARALVGQELTLAARTAVPEVLGRACRAHASILDCDSERLVALRRAVELLERSSARLEHARALSQLAAGERGHGNTVKARELAQRSWTIAEQLGANRVANQARDELVCAGGRPRRASVHGVGALTAAELKVATLAAQGITNTRIADTLVLATKTVEGHLANTYRKLNINGRAQLAAIILPAQ